MSSSIGRANDPQRSALPTFGAFPASKASMLIEKTPGLRRSTPDSEALASSDDEVEQTRAAHQALHSKVAKSQRRTSWLNEMPSQTRKLSNTMSGPYSPTTSHPATPSTEQVGWTSNASPGLTGSGTWNTSGSYPWGPIWNSENRKEAPSRLQEVLPSPTAINSPSAKFLADEFQGQNHPRGIGDAGLPFSIPLNPTPKTYRSQSYSVGQLDTGAVMPSILTTSSPNEAGRSRFGVPYPGLQRRSSRPSALNDRGQDSGTLDRVREVEDDEENSRDTSEIVPSSQQARTIERLERENAELRAAHSRERTSGSSTAGHGASSTFRNTRIRGSVPEEADLAVDDGEELNNLEAQDRNSNFRRMSEQGKYYTEHQPLSALENRNLENFRKAHWSTSLAFGSMAEPSHSRRHSFADVPTRHGSFSSNDRGEDELRGYENAAQDYTHGNDRELAPLSRIAQPSENELRQEFSRNRRYATDYFVSSESSRHEAEEKVQKAFAASNPYGRYGGVVPHLGPAAQPLYIVNFKCCRSDVFYIQEGTGLQVNPGDLVIVEADRGTDLGAVQHANVTWEQAKKFKEHYAEEHYKWLMMFSMQAKNGGPNAVNPNGLHGLHGAPGSAVGGMGPPGHHGSHDSPHTDLKPKMIKRLAQNHEIQALQEKEGNEAKAKRVCQQRVAEHRLNMEILDAEFQMDSKKLTFYYFADAYINFNSLVTDLFKIYKTRIWMSAINPASFVTPTASLGPVPAFGGNPLGRASPAGRRRPQGQSYLPTSPSVYDDSYGNDRPLVPPGGAPRQSFNTYQYAPMAQPSAFGMPGYPQSTIDPFATYSPYHMLNPNAPNFASSQGQDARSRGNQAGGNSNLFGRFQDLTL